MRIIEWTTSDLVGLGGRGLSRVLTESDESGRVVREIGLSGDVVKYIASSVDPQIGHRGLFDGQWIAQESSTGSDAVPYEEFERYWKRGLR